MKIKIIVIGKTDKAFLKEGLDLYVKRLKHYVLVDFIIIPDIKNSKNLSSEQQKDKEGKLILSKVDRDDKVILLDEKGKSYNSVEFSRFIENNMISSTKSLCFVIGGPYGFSSEVYGHAIFKISLSKMTFSHQMIRLIFFEQLYRAFTIIKGEPYHHA